MLLYCLAHLRGPRSRAGLERAFSTLLATPSHWQQSLSSPTKRIAIAGGGTGGIGALLGLLALPSNARRGWEIDLFEQRKAVGGIWLPDPADTHPPRLPESPLYPQLRTNTPVPTMTYPLFPFPPRTPLFPSPSHIQAYHESVVSQAQLSPYIHLSHKVTEATYDPQRRWTLHTKTDGSSEDSVRQYDHLIVANGHSHYPRQPHWDGEEEWLAAGDGSREIVHSMYYRDPERYRGRTVVVVGFGSSGWDLASQISQFADKVYHSFKDPSPQLDVSYVSGTIHKPRISHFTAGSVVFFDSSALNTTLPTTIILATGYDLLVPFLKPLSVGPLSPSVKQLTTNRRYIHPLYRDIFALDDALPPTALSFVGLPWFIGNAAFDYAQALFIGHAIADDKLLPSRETMLSELAEKQAQLRSSGYEPFEIGHRFVVPGAAESYQNDLVSLLRTKSSVALPAFLQDPSKPYVESWRRTGRARAMLLKRAWTRAEEKGVAGSFVEGVASEEEWAGAMKRLEEWDKRERESKEPRL